ncbi:MAG: protein kinase domain-containing protein [Euzebya sp.]
MKGPAPRPGPVTSDLLANRYVLEEHIATGGMAAVWRAHDEVLARTVAIKILHDDLSRQDTIRERFRREAVAAAKLVHPGIVSLFDTGVDSDRVYLVIEYIEGQTLAQILQSEVLEPGEVARIASRAAAGLAHAHGRGIIHRDIKPANVLISADGQVKVTDFGIAKAARDSTLTDTDRVMGTAAYVAPEQLQGQPIDARTDLYALGLVMYEAMTGQRAFPGTDPVTVAQARLSTGPLHPRQQRADIPRGLDELVAALTAPAPEDRPASAAQVVELLRPYQSGPSLPPPLDPVELDTDDGSIRAELKWLAPVGALLLLASALVGVGILGGVIDDGQISSVIAQVVEPAPVAPAPGRNQQSTTDDQVATESVPLTTVAAFDPQGDIDERNAFLGNLIDGAPATIWATERYNTAAFGGLKDGVGFQLDLGGPRILTEVILDVPRGGFDVEIRVAGRADPDPAAWVTAVAINDIGRGRTAYPLSENPQARYVLIWITGDLQPFETGFRAEIGEIRVQALAS